LIQIRRIDGCLKEWNDVWSEICQNFSADGALTSHIRDHIFDFVEINVRMIGKKPYQKHNGQAFHRGSRESTETPIVSYGSNRYYVHPDTNILCLAPTQRYRGKTQFPERVWEDDTHVNIEIDGIFYEVETVPYKKNWIAYKVVDSIRPNRSYMSGHYSYPYDEVFKRESQSEFDAKRIYGKAVVGVSKRQLNKREIKQRKLR